MIDNYRNSTKILILPEDWDDNAMEELQIPNLVSIIELERLRLEAEEKYKSSRKDSDRLKLLNFDRLILSMRHAYLIG